MLILTRCPGESIIIGETVKIIVLGRVGNTIRLGFEAPKEIIINRTEKAEQDERKKNRDYNNKKYYNITQEE